VPFRDDTTIARQTTFRFFLPCSLEHLYYGSTHKISINTSQWMRCAEEQFREVEPAHEEGSDYVLNITIKPGCRPGTRVTVTGESVFNVGSFLTGKVIPQHPQVGLAFGTDQILSSFSQKWVLDIEIIQVDHDRFDRVGNNLHAVVYASAADVEHGFAVDFEHIDGRILPLRFEGGFETVVSGEGMPVPDGGEGRGDLVVRVVVV
jgi:DnaJ-class molecular chaperone